ncbi:hypothetical protein NUW54_g5151 [Trametes sanguinea]|uniref:Uncharacterized protein n=1 Tax=Trametes sanguinea TaxID=158606 RepID=A0ACC1PWF2_9APHY|nr:hypothetical protein NUW54_g5151 [Trametes sanguinea]
MHVPAVIFPVAEVQQIVAEASQVRTVEHTLMVGNKLDCTRKLARKRSSRALPDLGNAVAMQNRRSAGEPQLDGRDVPKAMMLTLQSFKASAPPTQH